MKILSVHHGRGSQNSAQSARDRILAEAGEGGETINGAVCLAADGRIIGWRAADLGDGHEVCEYTPIEGLQLRLEFCEGKAEFYAQRVTEHEAGAERWQHRRQLAVQARRDEAQWRMEAEIIRERLVIVERMALGHLVVAAARGSMVARGAA